MRILIGEDFSAQSANLQTLFQTSYVPEGVSDPGQLVVSAVDSGDPDCACRALDLADQPEQAAAILDALGIALLNRGCHQEGGRLIELALNIRRVNFGDRHPATAASFVSHSHFLRESGELAKAEEEVLKAQRIYQDVFGRGSLPFALVLLELGLIKLQQSRFRDAQRAAQDGLGILQKLGLTETDRNSTRFMDVLARAQLSLGFVKDAEQTFKRLLTLDRKQLRTEAHPKFVTHRTNSAAVLMAQKRFAEAQDLYEKDIRFYSETLKLSCHPNLIDAHTLLSSAQRRVGDKQLQPAVESAKKALELNKKVRGEQHLRVGNSYVHLGIAEYDVSDTASALQCFSSAIVIYEQAVRDRRIDKDHLHFAEVFTWNGRILVEGSNPGSGLGSLKQAKAFLERALQIWPARLGPKSPGQGIALACLGRALFLENNNSTRARSLLDDAVEILLPVLGPDHSFFIRLEKWRAEAGLKPCGRSPGKSPKASTAKSPRKAK